MVISTKTSIEECSGTVNEDEDAEEIEICDICGDAGYDDELAICSRCNVAAEHIYCMATLHDSVPLQWICEACELGEKKGSEKKRVSRTEPLPMQACKKQITNELFSCSAMNEVENTLSVEKSSLRPISIESRTGITSSLLKGLTENIEPSLNSPSKRIFTGLVAFSSVGIDERFSGVKTQVHEEPNMSTNLGNFFVGEHAVEACHSTLRQGDEAVKAEVLSSPTWRGLSACLKSSVSGETNIKLASEMRLAGKSASKGNVGTAPKNASDRTNCSTDRPLLDPKRVFCTNASNSFEGEHAVEACHSTLRQGGEAVKAEVLLSPTQRGPSACLKSSVSGETNIKLAAEMRVAGKSALKGNADTAPKNASDRTNCPGDRSLLGPKRVFSRSVSMKSDDDQPSFLLPSKLRNLTRSKSAVVRPSAGWLSDSNNKSSYRGHDIDLHEGANKSSYRGHDNDLQHEGATRGTSCTMDRVKSTSGGPRPYRQAGQDSTKYDRSSKDLESLQHGGRNSDFGKETHNQSPTDLDASKHRGGDGRETRRCYRCDEVGHIAARCKNVSSIRLREWGGDRAPVCSEKTMAGKNPAPEGPWSVHSRKEEDSPNTISTWKSHDADCSGTYSKLSSNSKQTKLNGNKRLGTTDTVNTGPKLSPRPFEKRLVHDKQIAQVQGVDGQEANAAAPPSPSISFRICKQCSIEGNGMPQQAQGVDPMIVKHLQEPQRNQVILSSQWNECGSSIPMLTSEADTAVCTSYASHCEIQAEPCVEILWSGSFNVSSENCLTMYNGLQAHPSSKADPRVFEAIKTLPFELDVKELKRGVETDTWPRSLQEQPLTSNSIVVYFFPVDMGCHDIWYKPLLDHLSANDLALKRSMDFFQLLIFPSQLLPEAEQYWDDRQYLWGVLESSKAPQPGAL